MAEQPRHRDGRHQAPVDAPPADLEEQSQPWTEDDEPPPRPHIPPDAPEADVLEQSVPVQMDEDDHDR